MHPCDLSCFHESEVSDHVIGRIRVRIRIGEEWVEDPNGLTNHDLLLRRLLWHWRWVRLCRHWLGLLRRCRWTATSSSHSQNSRCLSPMLHPEKSPVLERIVGLLRLRGMLSGMSNKRGETRI